MTDVSKRFAGIVLLAPALPAFAQKPATATAASAPASQGNPTPDVSAPGDPTWMVVGVALLVGLVLGYLVGAWRSSARRASHA